MFKLILSLVFTTLMSSGYTQTKYEKEIRIKDEFVPDQALSFIDSFNFSNKIRWYQEFGLKKSSIEAKTKSKRKKYSIEFNTYGVLEDVEIKVNWNDLPAMTRNKIDEYLQFKYLKYSIDKVQIQYVGKPNKILSYIRNGANVDKLKINYELVISSKSNRIFKKYEYLFSKDGKYLKSVEIVLKNADNIEY